MIFNSIGREEWGVTDLVAAKAHQPMTFWCSFWLFHFSSWAQKAITNHLQVIWATEPKAEHERNRLDPAFAYYQSAQMDLACPRGTFFTLEGSTRAEMYVFLICLFVRKEGGWSFCIFSDPYLAMSNSSRDPIAENWAVRPGLARKQKVGVALAVQK